MRENEVASRRKEGFSAASMTTVGGQELVKPLGEPLIKSV